MRRNRERGGERERERRTKQRHGYCAPKPLLPPLSLLAGLHKGSHIKRKERVNGMQFGLSIGFGVWFFVQGLHDISVDMWTIAAMTSSVVSSEGSADAEGRLTYWRTYYEWRSDEVLLKGMVAPAIFLPTWAGILFAVPAAAFVVTEILKVRACVVGWARQ